MKKILSKERWTILVWMKTMINKTSCGQQQLHYFSRQYKWATCIGLCHWRKFYKTWIIPKSCGFLKTTTWWPKCHNIFYFLKPLCRKFITTWNISLKNYDNLLYRTKQVILENWCKKVRDNLSFRKQNIFHINFKNLQLFQARKDLKISNF